MWDRILYPVTNTLLTAYKSTVNTLKPFLRSSPDNELQRTKMTRDTGMKTPMPLKLRLIARGKKMQMWNLNIKRKLELRHEIFSLKKKTRVLPTSVYWKGKQWPTQMWHMQVGTTPQLCPQPFPVGQNPSIFSKKAVQAWQESLQMPETCRDTK